MCTNYTKAITLEDTCLFIVRFMYEIYYSNDS